MTEVLVRMPKLADTLVEGTVGQWLRQVGETVHRGDSLASIETDKVTTEIPSPGDGVVLELLVPVGETVPVDTPIARIGAEVAPRKVTPVARSTSQPLTPMRRAIAEHMTRASESIPHGQTVRDADLTELVAWREAHKDAGITFTVLFVQALARQLVAHLQRTVDVGVAVAVANGLIVPVVRGADHLSLLETANVVAELATRARTNRLELGETHGADMTVSNVGSFGNLLASPIIPLDQLGILAPGLVERRPMPTADGGIRPGWRCLISLMFDRRQFDDFAADRFLRGVVEELRGFPIRS